MVDIKDWDRRDEVYEEDDNAVDEDIVPNDEELTERALMMLENREPNTEELLKSFQERLILQHSQPSTVDLDELRRRIPIRKLNANSISLMRMRITQALLGGVENKGILDQFIGIATGKLTEDDVGAMQFKAMMFLLGKILPNSASVGGSVSNEKEALTYEEMITAKSKDKDGNTRSTTVKRKRNLSEIEE